MENKHLGNRKNPLRGGRAEAAYLHPSYWSGSEKHPRCSGGWPQRSSFNPTLCMTELQKLSGGEAEQPCEQSAGWPAGFLCFLWCVRTNSKLPVTLALISRAVPDFNSTTLETGDFQPWLWQPCSPHLLPSVWEVRKRRNKAPCPQTQGLLQAREHPCTSESAPKRPAGCAWSRSTAPAQDGGATFGPCCAPCSGETWF